MTHSIPPPRRQGTSRAGSPSPPLRAGGGRAAFTIVEIVIAMFVLVLLAGGMVAALTTLKYNAENNLYEATALNVAVSTIEQMKSVSYIKLEDPVDDSAGDEAFELITSSDATVFLKLGTANELEVPIVTREGGGTRKTITLTLTPSITPSSTYEAMWLEVEYAWTHPRTGRTHTGSVRNMRSAISGS